MAVSMCVDITKNNPSLGLRGARRAELLGLGGTPERGDFWEQREVPLEGHFSEGGELEEHSTSKGELLPSGNTELNSLQINTCKIGL